MIKYETTNLKERRKYKHLVISLGFFRFSFYQLRKNFCVRLEIKKGF